MSPSQEFPQRIVCLTEETTETLYLLGEDWRIVGISGFTVRPPRARREKPKVSAFISAHTERIVALQPDLVLGFSDLQGDLAATLGRAGARARGGTGAAAGAGRAAAAPPTRLLRGVG